MEAVAKSYMRKGFLLYEEMRKYLVIYEEAVSHILLCNRSLPDFYTLYEENLVYFFISVGWVHYLVGVLVCGRHCDGLAEASGTACTEIENKSEPIRRCYL
jgi:hypothetical protein